jgi:ribonucleoside-diphosphate reductase alpha chain
MKKDLKQLQQDNQAPSFLTEEGMQILSSGYLLEGETPRDAYERVAKAIVEFGAYKKDILEDIMFITYENPWLGYATPVLSNSGTDRGLPLSCYIIDVQDSVKGILKDGIGEMALLSKVGGGVGVNFNNIRPKGSFIQHGQGGLTDGVIPFAKAFDSAIMAAKQPKVRRGSASLNLDIEHLDFYDFVDIRRPEGDINRQCLNINNSVSISDSFMQRVLTGDSEARYKWLKLMKARIELGEPYMLFTDTVNRANPPGYKRLGFNNINYSNICSEILQYADKDHTVTCCLSSLNLEKYDEWKEWRSPRTGMSVPELGVYILDAIMEEFIQKASNFKGLSKAKNGAIKGRSIGLGAMGYHAYLQSKMLPFDSFESYRLNNEMFSFIKKESDKASRDLAVEKGEPEWCRGTGFRNAHRTALAPTKSNAVICSDTSASIEAYTANAFTENSAKGSFIRKNKFLKKILADLGLDTPKVWDKIARNGGSVQTMKELDDHTKQVFLTAYEINQEVFVRQAAQRQPYICQSQSLNLFFPHTVNPKYFSDVHILAWELGVKTLYYCKSTKATIETYEECAACHA